MKYVTSSKKSKRSATTILIGAGIAFSLLAAGCSTPAEETEVGEVGFFPAEPNQSDEAEKPRAAGFNLKETYNNLTGEETLTETYQSGKRAWVVSEPSGENYLLMENAYGNLFFSDGRNLIDAQDLNNGKLDYVKEQPMGELAKILFPEALTSESLRDALEAYFLANVSSSNEIGLEGLKAAAKTYRQEVGNEEDSEDISQVTSWGEVVLSEELMLVQTTYENERLSSITLTSSNLSFEATWLN